MSTMSIEQALALANAEHQAGRLGEAEAIYRQILRQRADCAAAWSNLGDALEARTAWNDAIDAHRHAAELRPDLVELQFKLANALQQGNFLEEAIAGYEKALALAPGDADLHNRLGFVHYLTGDLDKGIACLNQSLALDPASAPACSNLGSILRETGRLDEALAMFDRAMKLAPLPPIHSNRVYLMHFLPGADAQSILREQRGWDLLHARPLRGSIRAHDNDRDPDRRVRVGYVSPDFRVHVVGQNLLPLLQHHDRGKFEIFCYSGVIRPDAMTEQFRAVADQWRDILGVPDESLAEIIRDDKIDILVDLALHMAAHRLMVFARKPAPIQVTFGGYPAGTGLAAMDYRLSDPWLDPPEFDEHYVEKTVRLPHSFWCYDPVAMGVATEPAVNELPALGAGHIMFGCLNNLAKINDGALALWAAVLKQVPGSRLMLLAPLGETRARLADKISRLGIDPARLQLIARQERMDYFRLYHQIDIGLDTLPYNGHSTSLDSFFMGVPVVTLLGNTSVGRAAWSQLNNLKLTELAANSAQEFVRIAAELAGDLPRLAVLRAGLRARMLGSPLGDSSAFARGIEAAYHQMWRQWCAGGSSR